jgi:hypothetical protein
MDTIARRAFEGPDLELQAAGVTRASLVFAWHAGQSGSWMIMLLRLDSGGSVTELSVTGRFQWER